MSIDDRLQQAVAAITRADALLIAAGAGMGVDSGLPDFRGNQGFWRAYPPYQKLGLDFVSLANPRWFASDPALAWGFYGHRLNLYRATQPHAGFQILASWARRMSQGAFVFTSNVDGHFQRAGFDPERVMEVHGSLDYLQCSGSCGIAIFPADEAQLMVEEESMRAREPLPACPRCACLARPNVLMFGDWGWDDARVCEQRQRLEDWLHSACTRRLVIIECGAGTAIPTLRRFCEEIALQSGGLLVRINVREPEVAEGQVSLPLGALEALRRIDELLTKKRSSD